MFEELTSVRRDMIPLVMNTRKVTQCGDLLESDYSALHRMYREDHELRSGFNGFCFRSRGKSDGIINVLTSAEACDAVDIEPYQ
jgi:hypothetical protein